MVNLKEELEHNQAALLLMPSIEYHEVLVDSIKQLEGKSVCYVTLNKTSDSLIELFNKNNISMEDIVFVDAISKTIKESPDQAKNVYFVSNPGALTELSLVISKFLKHGFDYLIFDSITNLAIYQNKVQCIKFLSSLVNKVKKGKTKGIFYAIDLDDQKALIQEMGTFVDEFINVGDVVNKSAKVSKNSSKIITKK